MSTKTKHVQGRRKLRFATFEDVLSDIEKLATSSTLRMLGNWPIEQLLTHLTWALNASIDGTPIRAPWFLRMLGPMVKKRILRKGMSPGFKVGKKLEAKLFPPAPSRQEAIDKYRAAAHRTKTEQMSATHPVLGKLTHDEWLRLHLRHAELHLSFAVVS